MINIAIVDDDEQILDNLEQYLEQHDFRVSCFSKPQQFLDVFQQDARFDLIILDVMMPGLSGTEICSVIRKTSTVPIIMLSAAGDYIERTIGIEVGADDYVVKPFSLRELLARIKAILRRTKDQMPEPHELKISGYSFEGIVLDTKTHTLIAGEKHLQLPSSLYHVLLVLVTNPQQILTREQILDRLPQENLESSDRSIDVKISRLRTLLQQQFSCFDIVKTLRGEGYLFNTKVIPI
ncbi:MAG: response regulator transcription factor [Francisellaceae bacterium]